MKLPSPHYLVYDAQTYAEKGFIELSGKVRKMAQKPRYWSITATAHTQDPATGEQRYHKFGFKPHERCRLSELSEVINQRIHEEVKLLTGLFINGSKHSVTYSGNGMLSIGCHTHSIDEWIANADNIGIEEKYSTQQINEYKAYIQIAKAFHDNLKK